MNIDIKGMQKEKAQVEDLIEYITDELKSMQSVEISKQDARTCLRALKEYRKSQIETLKKT